MDSIGLWFAAIVALGLMVAYAFGKYTEYQKANGDSSESKRKLLFTVLGLVSEYADVAVSAAEKMNELTTNEEKLNFSIAYLSSVIDDLGIVDQVPVPDDLRPFIEAAVLRLRREENQAKNGMFISSIEMTEEN